MKIVLINPGMSAEKQAGSLKGVANMILPLRIGVVASVLEKNKFDVKIIDCVPENLSLEELKERIDREKPDLIGITATILSYDAALETGKKLKNYKIVIGGPHFTSVPEKVMQEECFDFGVIGEGEETILELCNALKYDKDFSKINGLVYRENGEIKINKRRELIKNLDELPFPALHLYPDLKKYTPMPGGYKQLPFAHMITSRGCPYRCVYCDRSVFGNRFRSQSPERVIKEIEFLVEKYGVKEIKFYDDTFTMDMERVSKICDLIIEKGIKITWSCSTRVDRVNKELLMKMKKAGCWQIDYGLESGDQRMLNIMKKGITLEQSRNAAKWTKEPGIRLRAFIILGMPGETNESIRNTIDFVKELGVDVVAFYALMIYPGNELYDMVKKEGRLLHEDYSQFSSLIDTKKTRLHYVPDGMNEEELKNWIRKAYKEVYLNPRYLTRQIGSIKNFGDVKRYWGAFKTIVRM